MQEVLGNLYDLIFRLLPHRAPTGLVRIGSPGPDSPVMVTGNYTLTLRRLRKVLNGEDIWLLAANSKGINVWCAATGGHLTHHDVITVIRTSRIAEQVNHRQLILPQLGATGIEGRLVAEATGWETKWGPARLEDLPSYLDRGQRVKQEERFMRFPLWERLEMATVWIVPLMAIGLPLAAIMGGWPTAVTFGLTVTAVVLALFAAVPRLNLRGWRRYAVFGSSALLGALVGTTVLALVGAAITTPVFTTAAMIIGAIALLAIDFEGTTPWYGGVVNTFLNRADIAINTSLCTGEAECVLVCPKDVLLMNSARQQVEIKRPAECVQCGACIVQCPTDALYFRYTDGRIIPASTIRSTRLNLAGRRSIQVTQGGN